MMYKERKREIERVRVGLCRKGAKGFVCTLGSWMMRRKTFRSAMADRASGCV